LPIALPAGAREREKRGYGNMKTVFILLLMIIISLLSSRPGISGNATVYQGGKIYSGWVDDKGKVTMVNEYGKTIMYGNVSRMGGIEITDMRTSETFEGRVNPMGKGSLFSKSGSKIRIELER